MVYFYNVLFILLYGAVCKITLPPRYTRLVFCLISALHIGAFHALRNPYVYPDNENYALAFERIAGFSLQENISVFGAYFNWGPGYVFLNYLLYKLSPNPEILFVTTSVLMVGAIIWVIFKCSYMPVVSVCLYLLYPLMFYQSLFVIRQHLAAAFIMLAVYYMDKRKLSVLLGLLAVSFHTSAIVFLLFFFFRRVKITKDTMSKITFYAILLVVGFNLALPYFMNVFSRYEHYADESGSSNIVPLFMIGALFLAHLANGTIKSINTEKDRNIWYYLAFGFMLCCCTLGLPGGGRLTNYCMYVIPLALPLLLKYNIKNKQWKYPFVVLYIVCVLFFFYHQMGSFRDYQFFHL